MADHHQQEVNTAKNGTKIRALSWSSDDDDDMVVISHPPTATSTTSVNMKRSHDEKKKAQQKSKSPTLVETVATAVPSRTIISTPASFTTPSLFLQKSISSEDDDENDFRHAVEILDPNKSNQDSAQEVLPASASPRRLQARADRRGKQRPANQKISSTQQTEGATGARTAALITITATLQQAKSRDKNDDDDDDDDDGDYWSVEDDDDGNDHENRQPAATASTPIPVAGTNNAQNSGGGGGRITLSREDIQVCQQLDAEYEQALEEREVGYAARYNSVRQSACFSVAFMLIYLTLGTLFFVRQAAETEAWTVSDSLLFSIYTITTVGCKFLAKKKNFIMDIYCSHSTRIFAEAHVFDLFLLFSWIFFSSRTLFTQMATCKLQKLQCFKCIPYFSFLLALPP